MKHAEVGKRFLSMEGVQSQIKMGELTLNVIHSIFPVFKVTCRSGSVLSYVVSSSEEFVRAYFNNINVLIDTIEVIETEGIAIFPENLETHNMPQDCSGLPTKDNPAFQNKKEKEDGS